MATFEVTRARQELGFTPSTAVRANIDVRTGEGAVGQAIGQAGLQAISTVSKIQQRRQQMQDTRSNIDASSIIQNAINGNKAFRLTTNDTKAWAVDLKERLTKAQAGINELDFSDDERVLANAKFQLKSQDAISLSLIAETGRDTETTRTQLKSDVVEQYTRGTPQDQQDAGERFLKNASLFIDPKDTLKTAIAAGQKARNKNAVVVKQSQAAEFPEATILEMDNELELRRQGEGNIPEGDLSSKDIIAIKKFAKSAQSKKKTDSEITANAATIDAYGQIRDASPGQPVDINSILDEIEDNSIISNEDKISASEKIKTYWSSWNSAKAARVEKLVTSNQTRIKANEIVSEVRRESVKLSDEVLAGQKQKGVNTETMSVLDRAYAKYNALESAEDIETTDNKVFMRAIQQADDDVQGIKDKAIKVAKTNAYKEGRGLMSKQFVGLDQETFLRDIGLVKGLTDEEKEQMNRRFTAEVNNRSLYERAVDDRYREMQDEGITDVSKYTAESLKLLLEYQKKTRLDLEAFEVSVLGEQKGIIKPSPSEAQVELDRRRGVSGG